MSIQHDELVIDDDNFRDHVDVVIEGKMMSKGAIPRDYSKNPVGSYESVRKFDLDLTPRIEWSSRIKDMEQSGSLLSQIRLKGNNGNPIPSLDQDGYGYCWAHSPVSGMLLVRARDHQPYVPLSAFSVACPIKKFKDEGGWNPLAYERIMKFGVAPMSVWPNQSVNRSLDNPDTWKTASRYTITEGIMDLQPAAYDRNLSLDQLITCLLAGMACPVDYNWWGHSICAADAVEIDSSLPLSDPNRWGVRIWNSWADTYGKLGMAVLRGNKAIPDGATAISVVTATEN